MRKWFTRTPRRASQAVRFCTVAYSGCRIWTLKVFLLHVSLAVLHLGFLHACSQIKKTPSVVTSSYERTRKGSSESVLCVTDWYEYQVCIVKLIANFFGTVAGPGRTSPYLRTSAKMKPIEESVEDDVFEAPSAEKLELQRLPWTNLSSDGVRACSKLQGERKESGS